MTSEELLSELRCGSSQECSFWEMRLDYEGPLPHEFVFDLSYSKAVDLINQFVSQKTDKAERDRTHTQDWYAVRLRVLEDWFRTEGKELPIADRFWGILANGSPSALEPAPTYAALLATKNHEIDRLKKELKAALEPKIGV